MSIIHSVKEALLSADPSKEKALMEFFDQDIRSENTFVYLKNSVKDTELIISSGEIKCYKKAMCDDKILTVYFSTLIKPYGKDDGDREFSINLREPNDRVVVFPSKYTIAELFKEMVNLKESEKALLSSENKLIFNPVLAKYLIRHGFRVVDTKQDRENTDVWIPVFLVSPGFYDAIDRYERFENYKKKRGIS